MLTNTDNKFTLTTTGDSGTLFIGHNSVIGNCGYNYYPYFQTIYPTFPIYAICDHCRKQEQLAYALATIPVGWLKLDTTSEPTRVFCSKKCIGDAMK